MGNLIDIAAPGQLLLRPPGGPPRMLAPEPGRWRESAAGSLLHDDPDLRIALLALLDGRFRLVMAVEGGEEVLYSERRLSLVEAFVLLPEVGRRWAERKVREAARGLTDAALCPPHLGRSAAEAWRDAHRLCRAAGMLTDLAAVLDEEARPGAVRRAA